MVGETPVAKPQKKEPSNSWEALMPNAHTPGLDQDTIGTTPRPFEALA